MSYKKIDPIFKALWIADLRSGKFTQCQGQLRDDYDEKKYCCLGLACDTFCRKIMKKKSIWVRSHNFATNTSETPIKTEFQFNKGFMPSWLSDKIKLPKRTQDRLAHMNDAGKTFDQIADWIEKYL